MNFLVHMKSSGHFKRISTSSPIIVVVISLVIFSYSPSSLSHNFSEATTATLATPATVATTPGDHFVLRNSSGRFKHSATTSRIVETQYGRLKGMIISIDLPGPQRSERVEAYLGIQYASLLGGELRFMPPTGPMEKWEGIKVCCARRGAVPTPGHKNERSSGCSRAIV